MALNRVLVTGGAGFIGSALCRRLLRDGAEVLCVDNLHSGRRQNLPEHRNFEFLRHDVTHPLYVEVDAIYNLACPASPVWYQRDPAQTVKTCVLGAINMLGLAKRLRAPILQASTSEVYGDPEVHPQVEEYVGHVNPIGPRACYDEGKRCAETLFADYERGHGVSVRTARIFNTYGPGMRADDGRVVSTLICQALRGERMTVFGDGTQTRSFCYVDDLVDGLVRLMASDVRGPVNLGNPEEVSVGRLAEMISAAVGGEVVYRPLPENDPRRRKPSIERARRELGWQPKVPLAMGLKRTIEHFGAVVKEEG